VAKVDTPCDRLDRVYLLSVASGVGTAEHSHTGIEFTQILSGALDDQGTIYRAGDFCEADAAQTHRPHVSGGEACVCLFATEGRLVPKGLIGRVAFALANV
jgi:putative transcriptional regulator